MHENQLEVSDWNRKFKIENLRGLIKFWSYSKYTSKILIMFRASWEIRLI